MSHKSLTKQSLKMLEKQFDLKSRSGQKIGARFNEKPGLNSYKKIDLANTKA